MVRALWKGLNVDKKILTFINKKIQKNKILFVSRNSAIFPKCINQVFFVYNGKKFVMLRVNQNMLGLKFGELIFTRKLGKVKKN